MVHPIGMSVGSGFQPVGNTSIQVSSGNVLAFTNQTISLSNLTSFTWNAGAVIFRRSIIGVY